jgi:hypothetical protein
MKLRVLSLLAVVGVLVASCKFSENIYLHNDGTGKMEFTMDASGLMAMAGDKLAEEAGEDQKVVDSTFSFKELFEGKQDSIAKLPKAQQEKIKMLEKFNMQMKMNAEEGEMLFNMYADFDSVDHLFNAMGAMSNIKGTSKQKMDKTPDIFSGEATSLTYSFNGSTFKRHNVVTDQELLEQQLDSIGEASMLFSSSTYTINYHFDKPVTFVSDTTAKFSDDRKTITIEKGFMEYLKNPELLNFTVELEK